MSKISLKRRIKMAWGWLEHPGFLPDIFNKYLKEGMTPEEAGEEYDSASKFGQQEALTDILIALQIINKRLNKLEKKIKV